MWFVLQAVACRRQPGAHEQSPAGTGRGVQLTRFIASFSLASFIRRPCRSGATVLDPHRCHRCLLQGLSTSIWLSVRPWPKMRLTSYRAYRRQRRRRSVNFVFWCHIRPDVCSSACALLWYLSFDMISDAFTTIRSPSWCVRWTSFPTLPQTFSRGMIYWRTACKHPACCLLFRRGSCTTLALSMSATCLERSHAEWRPPSHHLTDVAAPENKRKFGICCNYSCVAWISV